MALRPEIALCGIKVDKDGAWYYKGSEIVRREIVELLYRQLELDEDGRYLIRWRGTCCQVEVEDTPFVVEGITVVAGWKGIDEITLHLSDGATERLELNTLTIGPQNVPYCRVHHGKYPARFSRKAYYQLGRVVEQDPREGTFYLSVGSERVVLHGKPEAR